MVNQLKLVDDKEMLCASLISEYCYDEVKDVIEEACKHQLRADQIEYDKLEQEKLNAEATILELFNKLGDALHKVSELEQMVILQATQVKNLMERTRELEQIIHGADLNTLAWAKRVQELEQFDIRQIIPDGKYCSEYEVKECPFYWVDAEFGIDNCNYLKTTDLQHDRGGEFNNILKHPACPKPNKELPC